MHSAVDDTTQRVIGCVSARARRLTYNPAFAGAGAKVEVLCATPYGDFLGASRDALRAFVRRRTRELAAASQTPEIKIYNNMISGLRTRLSLAFWRSTAVARICSRFPRSEWYVRGLAKPVGCGVAAGSANIDFEIGPALA